MIKPTKEQDAIFHYVKKRDESLLIDAKAGCGKTSTIVEATKLISSTKSQIFLAFNKHIKDELKQKLRDNVYCYTFHSLGLGAIKRKYGDNVEVDEFKVNTIIKMKSKSWNLDKEFNDFSLKNNYLKGIKKLVDLCRQTLTTDKKWLPYLIKKYDIKLREKYDENLAKKDHSRVFSVLDAVIKDRTKIDYTDMIFLPVIDPSIWMYQYDVVWVDECFPYDQYISTTDGKKKIGQLAKMFKNNEQLPEVVSFNEKKQIFENKKIKSVWCNGKRDIYEIKLGGKRKIKSTKNHKYLTIDGWKRLDELSVGDAILSNYKKQPYHSILNESQKDLVIGTSLGDGTLSKLSKNIFRIKNIHGEKQKKYIDWKSKILDTNLEKINENGYSNKIAYTFNSLGFYFNDTYAEIKERVNLLNPKSLAILWMDDGSLVKHNNNGRLYALANNKSNVFFLKNVLNKKFKIQSKLRESKSSSTKRKYYYLEFNRKNMMILSNIISPYIHPSMEYKILKNDISNINLNNWNDKIIEYGCMVVTSEMKYIKTDDVYDMEVNDNHNFIITSSSYSKNINAKDYGFIAHNCQDLNRAQQKLIEKIIKRDKYTKKITGRIIACGDEKQAIYGFSGVSEKSFDWFRKFPKIKTLPLTTTFRCSKRIVEEAQKIVPQIQYHENAIDGIVRDGNVLTEPDDGDFVLCRTTAPLIKLFFKYLVDKKKAVIKGSDIGLSLIEMIDGYNSIESMLKYWEGKLSNYRNDLKKRGILNFSEDSGYVALEDKILVIDFLSKFSLNLDMSDKEKINHMKTNIKQIFTDELTGIVLSTIHKAKGLEANRVFIARPDKLPLPTTQPWQYEQEKNLEYVAITRAKRELVYDHEWIEE